MMYTKANALNGTPGIFACTYRVVVLFVPPLLSLGVLKQTGCVVLGAVIGIVVAVTSNRCGPRCSNNETEPTRGSRFGSYFRPPVLGHPSEAS